jgi:hypothetical protein
MTRNWQHLMTAPNTHAAGGIVIQGFAELVYEAVFSELVQVFTVHFH